MMYDEDVVNTNQSNFLSGNNQVRRMGENDATGGSGGGNSNDPIVEPTPKSPDTDPKLGPIPGASHGGGGTSGLGSTEPKLPSEPSFLNGAGDKPLPTSNRPALGSVKRSGKTAETVAHRINRMLKSDSPFIQQARERGLQSGNARGFASDSSISGVLAEREAYNAALPIAQQDAQTFFSQDIQNQRDANSFKMARVQGGINQQLQWTQGKINAYLANINGAYNLAGINIQAAAGLTQQVRDQIFQVQTNPDLTPDQKNDFLTTTEKQSSPERVARYS